MLAAPSRSGSSHGLPASEPGSVRFGFGWGSFSSGGSESVSSSMGRGVVALGEAGAGAPGTGRVKAAT